MSGDFGSGPQGVSPQTNTDELAASGQLPIPKVEQPSRPVIVYERAVQAIQECSTILEASRWNDKAEALAAWAKVYSDDRVMTEARALKLHAYRQIGRLADAMRIKMPKGSGYCGATGSTKGARSVIMEHGVSSSRAQNMLTIGRMDESKFTSAVARKKVPSPTQLCHFELRPNPFWAELQNRLAIFLTASKRIAPEKLAESLTEKQQLTALDMITRALVWLDKFEAAILSFREKSKSTKNEKRSST